MIITPPALVSAYVAKSALSKTLSFLLTVLTPVLAIGGAYIYDSIHDRLCSFNFFNSQEKRPLLEQKDEDDKCAVVFET